MGFTGTVFSSAPGIPRVAGVEPVVDDEELNRRATLIAPKEPPEPLVMTS